MLELLLRYNFDMLPDCDFDLGHRNLNLVRDTRLIILYFSVKFALVVYVQHNFWHNLTYDLIVTLTLDVGA